MEPAYNGRSTRVNAKTRDAATMPAGPDGAGRSGAGPDVFRGVYRAWLRGRVAALSAP